MAISISPLNRPEVKRRGNLIDLIPESGAWKIALQHAFLAVQQQFMFQTCTKPAYGRHDMPGLPQGLGRFNLKAL
ncbi:MULTISPECIES: hypothetical protein [unclassified Mesorhizobium]|uniref:hypothetical protein n=1 Tax=unclassified Mesorhizobium TaxID=325217 RepID=UPI00112A0476|nr:MULTISPECIES: hypothetical protein [unclassified Mesorhizobium]MBZ9950758.1 hypothetical protein [Mesorhizobium sp. BR1-1-11]MBZ9704693.1 hypothetical protein [Mesorhizobium sp. CO1-1-3]MBZ9898336.1 hypothetical protein [Mesorhizobium sp. BR1-1-6]TPI53183.1 hypothetical protein FJW11_16285 [Mesorhizobium sp. B3-1-1]TPJ60908.1 hypothetical protein FJ462_28030 [Mesorhizobium sp. B2-6-7]